MYKSEWLCEIILESAQSNILKNIGSAIKHSDWLIPNLHVLALQTNLVMK